MRNKDLKNHFLIAMPSINDPVFKKSLILICEDNQNGTMGLIVNKPIDNVLIKNMFLSSDIDDVYPAESKIYFGGPVNLDVGFVLHESNYHTDKTLNISNENVNTGFIGGDFKVTQSGNNLWIITGSVLIITIAIIIFVQYN